MLKESGQAIDGIEFYPRTGIGRQGARVSAHARWHNIVALATDPMPGVNLIGFSSDEGVRRNKGRVASSGPAELRRALSGLASPGVRVADLGTGSCAARTSRVRRNGSD